MVGMPRLRRPSLGAVLGGLALMVAMGGTAVGDSTVSAAKKLITGKQIANNSVTGTDIKNRSLLAKDFRAGQLPAGPRGPQGLTGQAGPIGPAGPRGLQGATGQPPAVEQPTTVSTFLNDWVPFDAGDTPVRFFKDSSGVVHLEGAVAGGDPGDTIFRLPVGYRPTPGYADFAVITTPADSQVLTPGYVQLCGASCDSSVDGMVFFVSGNSEYVSLNGISFRAR